jgi:hypothetical protein
MTSSGLVAALLADPVAVPLGLALALAGWIALRLMLRRLRARRPPAAPVRRPSKPWLASAALVLAVAWLGVAWARRQAAERALELPRTWTRVSSRHWSDHVAGSGIVLHLTAPAGAAVVEEEVRHWLDRRGLWDEASELSRTELEVAMLEAPRPQPRELHALDGAWAAERLLAEERPYRMFYRRRRGAGVLAAGLTVRVREETPATTSVEIWQYHIVNL